MNYIPTNLKINLEWTVKKGVGNEAEDFSRSTVALFVFSDENRWPVPCEADYTGVVKAQLPETMPEGVYSLDLVWYKNEGSLNATRSIQRTRKTCVFAIDAATLPPAGYEGQPVTLKMSSIAAPYGYDGLSAYEIAVLRGATNLDEYEWSKGLFNDVLANELAQNQEKTSRIEQRSIQLSVEIATERNRATNREDAIVREIGKIKPINNSGTINNAADEEDLTVTEDNLLCFRDREAISGMGYVILRKNKTFHEQVTLPNTIYEIRYDFDLNGQEITIPEGCVLDFQGGSFSNGTIVGNSTVITTARNGGIFNNVYFSGTYNITHIYDNWFLDSNKDLLKRLFALTSDNLYNVVYIDKDHIIELDEHRNGIVVNSNTDICLMGTIQIIPNSFEWYQIIQILNKSNISISGTGAIIGDRNNHLGNTGENGEGINIEHSENINIEGIKISNCWGDGIYIGGNRSDIVSKNININNVEIHNCRRQGISITHCDGFTFSNLNIYDIYGTDPQSALDIEPNENKKVVNGVISNSNLIGTNGVLLLNQNPSINIINNIQFVNCYISTSNNEGDAHVVHCSQIKENIKFIGCTLFNVSIEKTIYIDNGQNKIEFYDCIIGNKELVDRAFMSGGGCIVNGCRLYTGIYAGANYSHDIKTYITNTTFYGKTNTVSNSVITDCILLGGLDATNSYLENNEIKGSEYLNAASFYGDSKLVLRNGSVAKNNKIEYDGDTRITSGVVLYNDIILIGNNINCNAEIVLYSVSNHVTDIVIDNNIEGYIDGDFAIFKSRALTQGSTRPSLTSKDVGFQFFDLSIVPNRPVYWTGFKWVDATGAEV